MFFKKHLTIYSLSPPKVRVAYHTQKLPEKQPNPDEESLNFF